MKSKILRRGIAVLLSLLTIVSIMSVPLTVSARYTDEDIDNKISYHELNCREDDCDCLEPENDRFAVVSPSSLENTHNEYILVDTYQNVQDYFNEQGWTDGLPIVPPTWIKAEKFMRYTPYSDNDVVAVVNGRSVTAYQVAVNAIMSGCSAEYLPVCIAFVEALGDTSYLDSLRSGELTPMMYVNGPIARQLGIDNTQGMTTEECNIAIARFMELALINLAGLKDEDRRTNAFGNVQPLVFSEDEQNCINIGWDPHHVEAGFDLNDNVITATSFSMWGNNVTPATDLPEEIMKVMAWDITEKNLGGLGGLSIEDNANAKRTILITPSVAQALAKKYQSKDALENALVEHARRPLWMRTYAYYYANTGGALSRSFSEVYEELKNASEEDAKLTASPAWMNGITYANIDTVATMTKGNTAIVIQGDESRNKTQVMPGGVAVSKEIQLDTNWDDLLASMIVSIVYQPLSAHYITPVNNTVVLPAADGIPAELQVTKPTTYRIAASSTYANGTGRIYYDSATATLYYWDGSATQSVVLDTETYLDFVAFVSALGINSSFKLDRNNKVIEVIIRFSSNKTLPDKNVVDFNKASFGTVTPTIAANATSGSNGNASIDGSTITMNYTVNGFTADLGGTIVMGDTTDAGFVTLSGTTVTVDPTASTGATAVIGVSDGSGTYKTMTFVNSGDGTYKITYNSANTLTLTASSFYLKGTFNNWEATDAFAKTGNDDIISIIKELPAGSYSFKVHNVGSGEWFGNGGTINDTASRWTMDSSTNCTLNATGGKYEFKYEISTNKLSVYAAQADAVETPIPTPTTKTVYVGVVEHIKDFVPTLHYWNDAGLEGDATLTATGETVQYALGSSYWSNQKQNFKVYKTTIPVEATKMKTFKADGNTNWAAEEVAYAENQIILVFEYSDTYHNFKASYTPVIPCEHKNTETLKAVAATCDKTGLTEGKKCTDCGEVLTAQSVIPAKGHTEEILPAKNATCTEAGLTEGKKCSVCGTVLKAQTTIPAGHKEETVKGYDATCTDTGLTEGTKCSVCGETLKAQEEIPAKGHKEITLEGKDATCTETGLTEGKMCSVCKEVITEQTEIPKKGHTEVVDKAVAPTCTQTGLTEGKHCSVCNEVIAKQETVGKLPHTEKIVEGKDATCTEDGYTSAVICDVCGETISAKEIISATGHKEETLKGYGATCTEKGLTDGTKCNVCGETLKVQEEIPAFGHSESIVKGYAATCENDGLTDGRECSACGEVIAKQNVIPATGHCWNDGICENCNKICEHTYTDGKCTICGKNEYTAKVEGYSISLSGNIALNFYMSFSKDITDDESARVVFTLPNGSVKAVFVKNASMTDDGFYKFTCEVAAKEMTKVIKAQIVTSAGLVGVYEYSVQQYAEYIINSDDDKYTEAKPLAKAMLNYGTAAQEHFKYNLAALANKNLPIGDKVLGDVDLSEYAYKLTGKEEGIRYYGSKLTLESETAIKHYFYIENEDNIPTITVNGTEVKAQKTGSYYEVKIADILAQNLDAPVVVKIGNLTLDYNAFSYGYLAMQGEDVKVQNIIKALFVYNQAADAYLNIA